MRKGEYMRENTSSLGPPTPLNGPIKLAPVVRLTEPDGHGWSVGDQLIRKALVCVNEPTQIVSPFARRSRETAIC